MRGRCFYAARRKTRNPMFDTLTIVCVGLGLVMAGISLRNWRIGVCGLLAFMPFAGIPTIVLYPAPPSTRIIKDLLFVLPAYVGFAAWTLQKRRTKAMPLTLLAAALALTALAALHFFDTDLPVALIGLKTWVFYLPFVALGYHLVGSVDQLDRLVRWNLIVATLPIVTGLVQAILLYGGSPELAYGIYGAAGSDVTQGFGRLEIGTGDLARMASTFTFVSQYYNYVLAMLCLAYGRWRSLPVRSGSRFWLGMVPLMAVVLAGLLTGARGAFVMIPLFFVVALALSADWVGMIQVALLFAGGLTTAIALFKTSSMDLFAAIQELAVDYLTVTQVGELKQALGTTLWGLGTGANTGPARLVATVDPTVITLENYYAKAVMEFGLLGLLVVILIFAAVLWHGYRASRTTSDPIAKAYANALVAFLIVAVINEWKGAYLDIDPLNVYFWLFAGLLLRIPTMTPRIASAGKTVRPIAVRTTSPVMRPPFGQLPALWQ